MQGEIDGIVTPPTMAPTSRTWSRRVRASRAPAVLAAIALLAFSGVLRCGFTTWDDNVYVTENPRIGDLSPRGILEAFTTFDFCNYHPLTTLSYRIEHAIAGRDPRLYHLDNLLLHATAGVLVYFLLRNLLGGEVPAFLGALLFLIHPLRVESVAWIAERKDLLCAVFWLGALLAWPAGSRRRYGLSLALFVGALLSKVMAVSLPFAIAALLARERGGLRREVRALVPFAALAGVFAVLGLIAQARDGGLLGLEQTGIAGRLLGVPAALAFYAWKLVAPLVLSPRYVPDPVSGPLDLRVVAGTVLLAAAAFAAARSYRVRGPVFLGLALFAAAWAPVSGLLASSTPVADRYLYLPSVGLSLALLGAIDGARRGGGGASPAPWRVGYGLVAAAIAASVLLTPARVSVWTEDLSLWTDALRENPRNTIAHNQLATYWFRAGRYAEAAAAATEAVRHGLQTREHLDNLCVAYRGAGDARRELSTARAILDRWPDHLPARLVVLRHLREAGRLEECAALLEETETSHPGHPDVLAARGELESALGNSDRALALVVEALRRAPSDVALRLSACVLVARLGRPRDALADADRTLAGVRGGLEPAAEARLRELLEVVGERADPEESEVSRRLASRAGPRGTRAGAATSAALRARPPDP